MQSQIHDAGIAWKPGFRHHVPWAAFLNIFGFILCSIALGIVLWQSDGKDVDTWPSASRVIPASVLLSLFVSIGNLCLLVALGQGYEISWWVQAIKGAELRKLEFDLDIQNSIGALFSRHVSFDKFALAAVISLAVSVLDGPLIQKASTTTTKTYEPTSAGIGINVSNASLPADFSAYGTGPDLLTPLFSDISRAYASRDGIEMSVDSCNENITCALTLPAPGFDVSCTEKTVAYDFFNLAAGTKNNNITTFKVSFGFGADETFEDFSTINVTALYKPEAACSGHLVQRDCTLRLATVRYPVTVSNGTATIKNWQSNQNDTVELTSFPRTTTLYGYGALFTGSFAAGGFMSMLGGIAYVVEELYSSSVLLALSTMTFTPYTLYTSGQGASNYLTSNLSTYGNCTMTWEDPTTDIVNTVRELMFRSAIANSKANSSAVAPQQLAVRRTRVAAAYQSHYKYLGITLGCMVLQVLVIMFLLVGWNHLGREVSLDAFEIARALGAPLLRDGSSNSNIEDALAPLKHVRLRYGEILPEDAALLASSPGVQQEGRGLGGNGSAIYGVSKGDPETKAEAESRARLGLDQEQRVGEIRPGVLY